MKKFFLSFYSFLLLALLFCYTAYSGVMNFGWSKNCETGIILDMEFMPDNNYFIMATENTIDIRSTATGELVKTYPISVSQIEFPHDSTKIITIQSTRIQLRNLSDMSIIKEFISPNDEDSVNYRRSYYDLVIDPKKPYLYSINRSYRISDWFKYSRIHIINSETMEYVDELLVPNGDSLILEYIAVSKDGKYIAGINGYNSILNVWSLETKQNIRAFRLNPQPDKYNGISGIPKCIKFSELNSENIYYSGNFPQFKSDGYHNGLFKFSILENRIIDSTFGTKPLIIFQGNFTSFDNGIRLITVTGDGYLRVINQLSNEIEYKKYIRMQLMGCWDIIRKTRYSNTFIGYAGNLFSMGIYDSTIGVEEQQAAILYPNPTTGLVNIQTSCTEPGLKLEIYDSAGNLSVVSNPKLAGNNSIMIDMTTYSAGAYIIKIYCNTQISTYKIIKEG